MVSNCHLLWNMLEISNKSRIFVDFFFTNEACVWNAYSLSKNDINQVFTFSLIWCQRHLPILFYIESNKFLIIWIFNTIIWTNHKIRFAFRIVNMFLTSDCCWMNVHMRNTLILRRTKICASLGLIHVYK